MRLKIIAAVVMSLFVSGVASAHRLDEYLQATLVSVEKDHVEVSVRLIPGVAVSSAVIARIDTDGDGVLSRTEQLAYADRARSDLSLTADGERVKLKLVSAAFPQIEQMRDGVGEIRLEFTADLPRGGPDRKLVLVSHQQNQKAVYLVNCLVPRDRDIRIVAQKRNEQQSFYELDYVQDGVSSSSSLSRWWDSARGAMSALGLPNVFRLGMRHIAEGTDHLLFLLVLLLPAPLIATGSRWAGIAGVRTSVFRILSIVTSFTIGHSVTLALAAFGLVRVPSRPVEVLIAVSILLTAVHALRPIFPGKEAAIAAFFGLIHGLAFASTLGDLGLERWERIAGVLAFNLGIETMQVAVVAATIPSLLLMSRTRGYPFLRMSGAVFAVLASGGWIVERLLGLRSSVDVVVSNATHHAAWISGTLFLISLVCWRVKTVSLAGPVYAAPCTKAPC
jgi:HupE / UreJ protein